MKRLFILLILAAAHLICNAQANPKIEALYAYLKAQGIVHSYTVTNTNSYGLRKRFVVDLELYDENRFAAPPAGQYDSESLLRRIPGAKEDAEENATINGIKVKTLVVDGEEISLDEKDAIKKVESKIDSTYRAKATKNREAYNQIRRTLSELQENAAESYSYEYHQHGADTIITTMALKNAANTGDNVFSYKSPLSPVPEIQRAPEYVYFKYLNVPEETAKLSPYEAKGILCFIYDGIVGPAPKPTQDFDVAALQKKLAPIFKDKRIKRRELLCRHDPTFDRHAYNDSLNRIGQHTKGIQMMTTSSMGPGGESHYTIYKFTNEEQAKAVLHQVLDCVNQQIKDDPEQAYEVVSDAYFGTNYAIDIFSGYPCSQSYQDYYEGKCDVVKKMDIKSYMDTDGFYIIINVYQGDNTFPYEWKTLKSMVNGKKEYYKEAL
ncbi:MAG: hypothetical protein KBT39_11305 [Bacteroidales bacterium]|nr:hypothetical protein [Bacteroidales bacterium]